MNNVKIKKRKRIVKKSEAANVDDAVHSESKKQGDQPESSFVVPMVPDKNGVPVPALTREHLLEAELFLSKIATLQSESQRMNVEAQNLEQSAILQVRALRHEGSEKARRATDLREEAVRFWKKLSELYGIDFKHAGYDDETGLITVDPRHNQEE